MRVRAATNDDIQGIEALLWRSYSEMMLSSYSLDVLARALPATTKANCELVESGNFYVAEVEGSVVGCGGWSFTPPGKEASVASLIHARHFAADPDRARTGIGTAIFERLAADALAAGAVRIQALSSLNAEPFYRRMGLDHLDLISVPMGVGIELPVVLMEGHIRLL